MTDTKWAIIQRPFNRYSLAKVDAYNAPFWHFSSYFPLEVKENFCPGAFAIGDADAEYQESNSIPTVIMHEGGIEAMYYLSWKAKLIHSLN